MKKILSFTWFLFFCSVVSLIAQSSSDPTPLPTPTPPPANHYVGDSTSKTYIPSGVRVLEYCAFLRTKAAHESYDFNSDYWDSVFMSTSTTKLNGECCIIRTGSNGDYTYSVPIGRENYVIMALTSQTAFDQFNQWKKNPKAIEMRDYLNNKIAEKVSGLALYADQAYDIRDSYLECSPASFFDDLDALADELVNTPADFDAAGHATFCLADPEAGESLLYCDHIVGAEGLESANGFLGLPAKMAIYVHLYDEDLYSPYYRPNGVYQIQFNLGN
jgi:hypothetical protein